MKKNRLTVLLSMILSVFCIQTAFAGPFGVDMGMNLAEIRQACKTTPKYLEGDMYEIIPLKSNELFEKYIVKIDSDYGVYWLKAIGKNIYTNGYGDRLKETFESLVRSISKTYGEESYRNDSLKEGSYWGDSDEFMYSLLEGDRTLNAIWSKQLDITKEILSDSTYLNRIKSNKELLNDTTLIKEVVSEKISNYQKLPKDISIIGVFANALSPSIGCITLEYCFSNSTNVELKADSVF